MAIPWKNWKLSNYFLRRLLTFKKVKKLWILPTGIEPGTFLVRQKPLQYRSSWNRKHVENKKLLGLFSQRWNKMEIIFKIYLFYPIHIWTWLRTYFIADIAHFRESSLFTNWLTSVSHQISYLTTFSKCPYSICHFQKG